MRKSSLLVFWVCQFTILFGQYTVSSLNTSYFDVSRNRAVSCGVYYPSVIDSVPGNTQFPYIIFGHGFSMGINSYQFLAEGIVPKGVILIMPSTETSLSPSHELFAGDMAFLGNYFYQQSLEPGTQFFGSVREDYFLMGHSMGGGAAHLASSYSQEPGAVITFAAAETTPSAISAASGYSGKIILFYGQNDNVTPLADHQQPIYENSGSSCKFLVEITGGIHCYFNDYNLACWIGETAVGSVAEITREEQQDIVLDYLTLLVESELYGIQQSWGMFMDSVNGSPRTSSLFDCTQNSTGSLYSTERFELMPNPANGFVLVSTGSDQPMEVSFYNLSGILVRSEWVTNKKELGISTMSPGIYFVRSENKIVRLAIM
jgi:hypothetical protein